MSPAPKHSPQELETLILDAAAECIENASLLDFTMAAIAKEAGVSMGSIYKHVQSKEDVLVALATRMASDQRHAFAEMMAFPLSMPERLMCTVLLSPNKLHSYSFGVHLEMMTGNEAVLQRASPRWCEALARINQSVEQVFFEALRDSCDAGELIGNAEDRDRTIETLSISLWSMCVGFIQAAYQRQAWNRTGALPFPLPSSHEIVDGAERLINSFKWRAPLTAEGREKACAILEERGYR